MFDNIFNNIYLMLKVDNKILKELKNDFNMDEIQNGILNSNIVKYRDDKYNRIVLKRNELLEMVLICWQPNQFTEIHGHPSGGCLYKVLKGEIVEERYSDMKVLLEKSTIDSNNNIQYIDNSICLHKMNNISELPCISLHFYSPPFI